MILCGNETHFEKIAFSVLYSAKNKCCLDLALKTLPSVMVA